MEHSRMNGHGPVSERARPRGIHDGPSYAAQPRDHHLVTVIPFWLQDVPSCEALWKKMLLHPVFIMPKPRSKMDTLRRPTAKWPGGG
ncbi:hypothetical protein SKAU_G00267180 [Synaphobranchus kaupii]|uniref:Uncharacterized protein n=1 Tax=Synaphobranchus kaupii TaxID=118154 RepID=A0A9Q1EZG5_SYNKA|nr:hypothetical protein SKAU_G00267180 [Synaphobranchus kaupii]